MKIRERIIQLIYIKYLIRKALYKVLLIPCLGTCGNKGDRNLSDMKYNEQDENYRKDYLDKNFEIQSF